MCTDLGNDAAPLGAAQATLSPLAFKKWLKKWLVQYGGVGKDRVTIDEENPGQVVVMLYEGSEITSGNMRYTPNWHLTAMTDRLKTRCNNFHFKVEASKAAAHYWHYVLYRNAGTGSWFWVGDPNPNIPGRNDAGGGAANDVGLLNGNRALVDSVARGHQMDNKVTRRTQASMVKLLQKMCTAAEITDQNGIWR